MNLPPATVAVPSPHALADLPGGGFPSSLGSRSLLWEVAGLGWSAGAQCFLLTSHSLGEALHCCLPVSELALGFYL